MSDAGNILPQAEIDALFKQATGRSLSAPPEVQAAKIVAAKEEQTPPNPGTPKPAMKSEEISSSPPPSAPANNVSSTAETTAINNVLNKLMDTMETLTKRIEAIEKNISGSDTEKPDYPDYSSTINNLTTKVNSESFNIQQINNQLLKLKKQLKGTPGFAAREQFTCSACGSQGYVAVPMKCSSCGTEGWWGWYPEKQHSR